MGLRGPKPQPTALRIVRGNPGKRPLPKNEPKPAEFANDPPPHLDKEAIDEWHRLVPILLRMKVLTEADYIALAGLCQAYSTMVKAQKALTKAGLLFKTSTGYIQQSPLLTIVNQNMDIVTKLLREFGLTPSSRTRVQTNHGDAKEENPWAKYAKP